MPLAVDGRNIVVQSKSGTGKTLAFVGVVMQRLIEEGIREVREEVEEGRKGGVAKVRVLVLEPTRELAVQVYQFVRKVMAAFKNIKPVDDLHKQIKSIINNLTAGLNIGGLPIDDDKKNYH
jgi:superfamily II DNA/RNA helicase